LLAALQAFAALKPLLRTKSRWSTSKKFGAKDAAFRELPF
jgi:hypothetical protein